MIHISLMEGSFFHPQSTLDGASRHDLQDRCWQNNCWTSHVPLSRFIQWGVPKSSKVGLWNRVSVYPVVLLPGFKRTVTGQNALRELRTTAQTSDKKHMNNQKWLYLLCNPPNNHCLSREPFLTKRSQLLPGGRTIYCNVFDFLLMSFKVIVIVNDHMFILSIL